MRTVTAEAVTDPEGVALVSAIHTRKLTADLERQEANWARLVQEAAQLGTKPGAHDAWELVHEAASITAKTKSRLTQHRWTT